MFHAGKMVIMSRISPKGKYFTLLLKYYFKYNRNSHDLRSIFTVKLHQGILIFKIFYSLLESFYPVFSLQMHVWKI